jgi:hypothetical protein
LVRRELLDLGIVGLHFVEDCCAVHKSILWLHDLNPCECANAPRATAPIARDGDENTHTYIPLGIIPQL